MGAVREFGCAVVRHGGLIYCDGALRCTTFIYGEHYTVGPIPMHPIICKYLVAIHAEQEFQKKT